MREGEGTWLGHVLEHVAIELQNMAGEDVTFGKTRSISEDRPGVYSVIYEYEQKEVGIGAGELALRPPESLLPEDRRTPGNLPGDWEWDTGRQDFISSAQRSALGTTPPSPVPAHAGRDLPRRRPTLPHSLPFVHSLYPTHLHA